MDNKEFIAGLPMQACRSRGNGVYSITTRTAFGEMTPEVLNTINSLVQDLQLPGIRVTGFQQIQLLGVPEDKVRYVVETLGDSVDFSKYVVQACAGNRSCKFGMQDSIAMAEKLEAFLNDFTFPSKLKSGIAGCSMGCAEPYVRDVGLVGKKSGWTVLFGGNAGKGVRKGDALAEDVTEKEVFEILRKALDFYAENAKKKERTARFVERVGIEAVLEAVNAS